MTDERMLTLAKLREQARGDLDGGDRLLDLGGLPLPDQQVGGLTFLQHSLRRADSDAAGLGDTTAGAQLLEAAETSIASRSVRDGDGSVASYLVGVTEQDLDASSLRLPVQLLSELENDGAPAFLSIAGNPNTGKTNLGFMAAELREAQLDEYLILSNVASSTSTDIVVTSAYDLLVALLEHRETPKAVLLDEGSTHLDAGVYAYEVRTQLTPMAKRFAKLGVDIFAAIGHTGKDLHPECKRLTTLAAFKSERTTAEFFEDWPAESDAPSGRKFGGPVEEIEPAVDEYAPDDAAPWAWNLPEGIFAQDLDWPELLEWLRDAGPAES